MRKSILVGLYLVIIFCFCSGCFNRVPPYTGENIGRWEITLNNNNTYDFNLDRNRFETKHNCEICCSGTVESWKIEHGTLNGKTSCNKIVVTFKGDSDDKTCSGVYKVYTVTGEFLREGKFKGQKM